MFKLLQLTISSFDVNLNTKGHFHARLRLIASYCSATLRRYAILCSIKIWFPFSPDSMRRY